MARDATNMPNPRSTTYQGAEKVTDVNEKLDINLKIENMLLEEFNYAGVTAYQAMEDRARMFNFYLLLVGVIVSGLGVAYQLGVSANSYSRPMEIITLLIAGIVGVAFFVKLIRLRQAWRESVICMNVIKEFYIQQFQQQMPHINQAFRWRLKTIPAGEHHGSTTYIVCFTVALIESICFAGAAFMLFNAISLLSGHIYPYIIAVIIFVCVLILNFIYYHHSLNIHNEIAAIQKQANEIGE